jgi:hypothetical protein
MLRHGHKITLMTVTNLLMRWTMFASKYGLHILQAEAVSFFLFVMEAGRDLMAGGGIFCPMPFY